MKRTYLALVGLGLSATAVHSLTSPLARAQNVFSSVPLDSSRFAVLGRPIGHADWSLMVVEQVADGPRCWDQRPDGLVDAAPNRVDSASVCDRYTDSNGYSLRVADQDLGGRYRLRLRQVGQELQLQAMSPNETNPLVVGRGTVPRRDPDGFVPIRLEADWQLGRRQFGQETLRHVYFANAAPLAQLIAQAGGAGGGGGTAVPFGAIRNPAEPVSPAETIGADTDMASFSSGSDLGVVALQVVPFTE
jgi:hypothetical protein